MLMSFKQSGNSNRSRSDDTLTETLFTEVISLSHQRIKQRLQPPSSGKTLLHERLREAISPFCSGNHDKFDEFSRVSSRILSAHLWDPEDSKALVIMAYSLTESVGPNGCSILKELLRQTDMSLSLESTKLIAKFRQLGRYWALCQSLVKITKKHSLLFQRTSIERLPPFLPWLQKGKSYHVHAEIQLILHYEASPHYPMPRIVGSSKKACYLCDLFIQKHRQFFVTKTHGRLYHQWTVLEIPGLGQDSIEKLRRTIQEVQQELDEKARILQAQAYRDFVPYPIESSVDTFHPGLSSSTISTIKPSGEVRISSRTSSRTPTLRSPQGKSQSPTARVRSPIVRVTSPPAAGPSKLNQVTNVEDGSLLSPYPGRDALGHVSATRGLEADQVSTISSIPGSIAPETSPLSLISPTILQPGRPSTSKVCKDCFIDIKAGSISKITTFESSPRLSIKATQDPDNKSYQQGIVTHHHLTQEEVAQGGFEAFRCRDLKVGEERTFTVDVADGANPTLNLHIKNGKDVLRTLFAWK